MSVSAEAPDRIAADRIDREELSRLSERSDQAGLIRLAGHGGLILACSFVIAASSGHWLIWPAMLMQGIALSFLFTAEHEAIHRTAFRSRWLNDAVAWACGLVLGLPPNYFRAFHFAHHRHTQIEGSDPELGGKRITTWSQYLLALTGWHFWRGNLQALASHALGRVTAPYIAANARARIVREARIMVAVYGLLTGLSLLAGSDALLTYWIVPMLLGQPALRAYLMAEHGGCPRVASMFENTRTTLTGWPVRLIAWNMPFHTEHHAYPAVPFHKLPELHQLIRERLVNVSDGYLRFHLHFQQELQSERRRDLQHGDPPDQE